MDTKKIQKIKPGIVVSTEGVHSLGILSNKAYLSGTLTEITLNPHKKMYFIDSKTAIYIPSKDDIVIGKIICKTMDFYKIELGNSFIGYLPVLAFPNVTRRNKPELNLDDYVISRIVVDSQDSVLYCDEGLGKIDGYVFEVPVWKIRKLILSDFLSLLGKEYRFKIGLGLNGRLFINSESSVVVKNVIQRINAF